MNHSFEDISACLFHIETCASGSFNFDFMCAEWLNVFYTFIVTPKQKSLESDLEKFLLVRQANLSPSLIAAR